MIDRARALPQRAIRQLDFRLRAQPSKQAPAPPGGTGKARTLYQLLGLSNSAINADVRAAYRRLAAQHHPDVAQTPRVLRAGGEAQFFQVRRAPTIQLLPGCVETEPNVHFCGRRRDAGITSARGLC